MPSPKLVAELHEIIQANRKKLGLEPLTQCVCGRWIIDRCPVCEEREHERQEAVSACLGGCGKPIIGRPGRCVDCTIDWITRGAA